MGSAATDRIKEIADLAQGLPDSSLQELLDFAEFLRIKKEGFSYRKVADSAVYVRDLREKEGKRMKSGQAFINELVEWQKSNS